MRQKGFCCKKEDEDGLIKYIARMTRHFQSLDLKHRKIISRILQRILTGDWHRLDKEAVKAARASAKWFISNHHPRHSVMYLLRRATIQKRKAAKPNQRRRGIG